MTKRKEENKSAELRVRDVCGSAGASIEIAHLHLYGTSLQTIPTHALGTGPNDAFTATLEKAAATVGVDGVAGSMQITLGLAFCDARYHNIP